MKHIVLLLLLLASFSYSQSKEGLVLDRETQQPVEGVHITSPVLTTNTFSNEQGKYMLQLKSNFRSLDTLFFSAIGYNTIAITIVTLEENDHTAYLSPNSEILHEVNITSAKKIKITYRLP